jgi:hypothetical protein
VVSRLEAERDRTPNKVPLAQVRPEARLLETERKLLTHAVRMSAYNSESALARLLGPLYARSAGEYRGSRSGSTEFRIWGAAPLVGVKQFYSQPPRGCCPGAGGCRREGRWHVPGGGPDFERRRRASLAGRSSPSDRAAGPGRSPRAGVKVRFQPSILGLADPG